MELYSDKYWMSYALSEAKKSADKDEVPVGSIIVLGNNLISGGHNSPILDSDPTSHAELNAIRLASKKITNYRLNNSTLYTTLEPCVMCFGAIVHARISKIVFGAYDSKSGVCGSCATITNLNCFNHEPEIIGGVLELECSTILKNFFKQKRS